VEQLEKMGEEEWSQIISTGVNFASDVCISYENYVSQKFAESYK